MSTYDENYFAYLQCTTGGSHKHYYIGIIPSKGGMSTMYDVVSMWGPIGGTLKEGKGVQTVSLATAKEKLRSLRTEKKNKGYKLVEDWPKGNSPDWWPKGKKDSNLWQDPVETKKPAGIPKREAEWDW